MKNYNLSKIRELLTEGFAEEELRIFSHDTPDFKPVYNRLAQSTGKADLISYLLEHAEQKVLLEKLLAWAKKNNPARYEAHQPYFEKAHVFISYKRNIQPDESVALQLFEALGKEYEVFIDQPTLPGASGIERIEAELRQTDFLIILLSAESIVSEMVLGKIQIVDQLTETQAGRPTLLPVRLAYREPFQYPLSEYLNPLNWAAWDSEADTPRLIEELKQAVSGGALSIDAQSKAQFLQASPPPRCLTRWPQLNPSAWNYPEGRLTRNPPFM